MERIFQTSTNKFHSYFKNDYLQAIIKINEQFEGDFLWQNIRKN